VTGDRRDNYEELDELPDQPFDDRFDDRHDDRSQRAAPVVMDDDDYPDLPPPVAPNLGRYEAPGVDSRTALTRLLAVLTAIAVAAWALGYHAQEITSPEVALPVHERAIEALIGLDHLLLIHEDVIRTNAEQAIDPSEPVEIPGLFMSDVTISAGEIEGASRDEWYALLINRGAAVTYREGLSVFNEERVNIQASPFSTTGMATRMLGNLSEHRHDQFAPIGWPLAASALILAILLLIVGRGLGRYVALGVALITAGALVALASAFAIFLVGFAGSDGSAIASELSSMAGQLARSPLRTAMWIALAGCAIALPAMILRAAIDRRPREDYEPGYGRV
jgi:hypothetical protein